MGCASSKGGAPALQQQGDDVGQGAAAPSLPAAAPSAAAPSPVSHATTAELDMARHAATRATADKVTAAVSSGEELFGGEGGVAACAGSSAAALGTAAGAGAGSSGALRPMSGRRGAVEAEFDYRQLPAARAAPGIGSGLGPAPGGLLLRNPDWLSPGGAGKLPPVAGRGGAKLPPVMYSNERAPAAVGAPTSTSAVALPQQQEAAAGLTISESATVAPPPQPQGDASLQNQEQRPHSTAQVQPQYAASPPMAVGTTAAAQPTANPEQQLQSPSESATADTWHALESNYTSAQPPSSHPSPERHAIKPVHEAVLEVGSDEDDACGDNAWGGAEELASAGRVLAATCAAGSSAAVGALAATPHAVTTPLQGQQLAGAAAIGGAAQHSAVAASGICSGKRGGWGEGALAAPGTLMVGSQAPPADADEDVFGGCDAWGTPGPHAIAAAARAPQTGANGVAAPHNTCVVANLGSAADDAVVEDFEDEDVTAELAAQGALPGDLAAKLAQYERMLEEDVE